LLLARTLFIEETVLTLKEVINMQTAIPDPFKGSLDSTVAREFCIARVLRIIQTQKKELFFTSKVD